MDFLNKLFGKKQSTKSDKENAQQLERQGVANQKPLESSKDLSDPPSRVVIICCKAEMSSSDFRAPLKKIVDTYQYHKNVPADAIKYFVSPKITLPDINDQMFCNMFIFASLTANKIKQPNNMSWNADLYKEGNYSFIVFDIKLS
jgi:hypothetical protein